MNATSTRVLIVDDSAADAELMCYALRDYPIAITSRRVDTEGEMLAALDGFDPEIILSDFRMPEFSGEAALNLVLQVRPEIPVIVVSGTLGDEQAVKLLKLGAKDYLLKENLARLGSAVTRALAEAEHDACRKHDLAALRDSEARFRTIFEQASVGISRMTLDGRYTHVNDRLCAILGYSRDELIGRTFGEITHPEDAARDHDHLVKMRAGEVSSYAAEKRYLRKDGSVVWCAITVAPVLYANGNIDYLVTVTEDITARKEYESELLFKNAILTTQQETSLDGILVVDDTQNVVSFNQRFVAMWGISDEVIASRSDGRALQSVLGQLENPAAFLESVKYLYEHKQEKITDELQLKDGRTFDRFSAPMLGLEGRYFGRVFYFRDVTERKQAERALRQSLEATIAAVAATVESRDPYTAGHQRRVAGLAVSIAREMGLDEDSIQGLRLGALVHDLGKVQVPAEILSKPAKLNRAEYELIKMHPQAGYDILKGIAFPWPVADIVHQHHERLDGSGYPRGLKGNAIVREARILAVADVVEAMASHRPYRASKGIDAALKEIEDRRGLWFEPEAVDACVRLFREQRFKFEEL